MDAMRSCLTSATIVLFTSTQSSPTIFLDWFSATGGRMPWKPCPSVQPVKHMTSSHQSIHLHLVSLKYKVNYIYTTALRVLFSWLNVVKQIDDKNTIEPMPSCPSPEAHVLLTSIQSPSMHFSWLTQRKKDFSWLTQWKEYYDTEPLKALTSCSDKAALHVKPINFMHFSWLLQWKH